MKASTPYDDLIGTASASISDRTPDHQLEELAVLFGINRNRYKTVGLEIHGTTTIRISFICVDQEKSSENEHIVRINVNEDVDDALALLFKSFHVVLYRNRDTNYSTKDINEEKPLSTSIKD